MTAPTSTIVWNGFFFTVVTGFDVHPQVFVRAGLKPAYGAGKHGGCKFVLPTMMFWMSADIMKFPYQNQTGRF